MPLSSIPAAQALARLKANRLSLWPDGRRDKTRLQGITDVAFEPGFVFEPGEAIFTIGSCFARNIESRLLEAGFDLPTLSLALPSEERASDTENDLLNKYTPHAILNELRWALEPGQSFPADGFLNVRRDLWHDPHLAGNVAHASLERVRERRLQVEAIYREAPRCRVVVLTLGLVEAWFDHKIGAYLNGAPPAPVVAAEKDRFSLDILSVADVVETLEQIHALLTRRGHPDLRVLLTVSPVPLKATFTGKDCITANTYSKSVLRAAAEQFVIAHDNVDYFPSYEIVTHTSRSAAYIQDNRHVTPSIVKEIVERVLESYCPGNEVSAPTRSAKHLNTLLKIGDWETALTIFERLDRRERYREVGMTPADFHLAFGKTLSRTGAHARAQTELMKAVEFAPDSASANYNLGITLNKLQRPLEAAQYIRRSVELAPESVEMRLRYVRQLAANGDFEEARAQLRISSTLEQDAAAFADVAKELEAHIAAAKAA